ncbi:MAG: hypothetical protein K6F92_07185 [Lachnospiraceae bacterium]|nr:hypothetical protein [Lachnospiraceae bacterium]
MKLYMDDPQVETVAKTEEGAEREAIKKTFDGEKKKLSAMTWEERFSYIWSYYKVPILLGTFIIIVLIYLINVFATRKDTMLMGVIIGDGATNKAAVEVELARYLGLDQKQQVDIQQGIYLTHGYSTGVNTGNMGGASQIMAYIATRELDFYIASEDGLNYMISNKISKDLQTYLPADIYEELSDRIVTDEEGRATAIDITGTPLYEKLGLHSNTMEKAYVGFCTLSGHEEQVQGLIRWIYEQCK